MDGISCSETGLRGFCVPGSIFSPASRFTNRMIKEGAELMATPGDVLEELNQTAAAR